MHRRRVRGDRVGGAARAHLGDAAGEVAPATLDPEKKHEPQASTVSAVRAIAWSAATLGLRVPPVFVDPGEALPFEIVPALPPALRVGAPMLSGAERDLESRLPLRAAPHVVPRGALRVHPRADDRGTSRSCSSRRCPSGRRRSICSPRCARGSRSWPQAIMPVLDDAKLAQAARAVRAVRGARGTHEPATMGAGRGVDGAARGAAPLPATLRIRRATP